MPSKHETFAWTSRPRFLQVDSGQNHQETFPGWASSKGHSITSPCTTTRPLKTYMHAAHSPVVLPRVHTYIDIYIRTNCSTTLHCFLEGLLLKIDLTLFTLRVIRSTYLFPRFLMYIEKTNWLASESQILFLFPVRLLTSFVGFANIPLRLLLTAFHSIQNILENGGGNHTVEGEVILKPTYTIKAFPT